MRTGKIIISQMSHLQSVIPSNHMGEHLSTAYSYKWPVNELLKGTRVIERDVPDAYRLAADTLLFCCAYAIIPQPTASSVPGCQAME